jgi:hypothetical protein
MSPSSALLLFIVCVAAAVASAVASDRRFPLRKDREDLAVAVVQVIEQSLTIPEQWRDLLLFTPPFDGSIMTKAQLVLNFAARVAADDPCRAYAASVAVMSDEGRRAGALIQCRRIGVPLSREALADIRLAKRLSMIL